MRDYFLWLLGEDEEEEEESLALAPLKEEARERVRPRRGPAFADLGKTKRAQGQARSLEKAALAEQVALGSRAEASASVARQTRVRARILQSESIAAQEASASVQASFSLPEAAAEKRRLAEFAKSRQPLASRQSAEEKSEGTGESLDVLAFDRELERDARRYDKGFSLF